MKEPEAPSLKGKLAKSAMHLVLGHATGGAGNLALEGASHAAEALKTRAANAALAEELRLAGDAPAARARANEAAANLAAQLRARSAAGGAAARTAPVAGTIQDRSR
ncbi:MAG: hypothetical protein JOY99_11040 [Sphingomonadaceae bacterium]|nr:hypothetical protein [Sphingomonadaceae bacterium]